MKAWYWGAVVFLAMAACTVGGGDAVAGVLRDAGNALIDAGAMVEGMGPVDAAASTAVDGTLPNATPDGSRPGEGAGGSPRTVLEADCDQVYSSRISYDNSVWAAGSYTESTQSYARLPSSRALTDVVSVLGCGWMERTSLPKCPDGATCSHSGSEMPRGACQTIVGIRKSGDAFFVSCGSTNTTHFIAKSGGAVTDSTQSVGYQTIKIVLQ